jgi:hypothetical protein
MVATDPGPSDKIMKDLDEAIENVLIPSARFQRPEIINAEALLQLNGRVDVTIVSVDTAARKDLVEVSVLRQFQDERSKSPASRRKINIGIWKVTPTSLRPVGARRGMLLDPLDVLDQVREHIRLRRSGSGGCPRIIWCRWSVPRFARSDR